MISKCLLSKILDINVTEIGLITSKVNLWFLCTTESDCINIYELSHLCKQWTVKNSGWTLQSYTNERDAGICRVKVGDGQEINKFIATSEVEAIFKATDWVYTELKNKGKLK